MFSSIKINVDLTSISIKNKQAPYILPNQNLSCPINIFQTQRDIFKSQDLDAKIQRQTKISWSNSIREPIRTKHRRILIRNATQLHIRPSRLIAPLQIKVCIGNTVCASDIPRGRLSVQLLL